MKKTIITIAAIVVAVLGFVAYSVFFSSKVPQAFIDKHNETVALGEEAEKLSDLTNMPEANALEKQIEKEDYAGALKSVEAALGRKNDTAAKLNAIDVKLAELTTLSSGISNAAVKAGTDKFIDISKKENSAKIKYNNIQIQAFEKTKTMIGILAKNPKAMSAADGKTVNDLAKQINDLKNQMDNAEKSVNDIQSQYKTMEEEFFKLAGLEKSK
jgi:hypothetical protein